MQAGELLEIPVLVVTSLALASATVTEIVHGLPPDVPTLLAWMLLVQVDEVEVVIDPKDIELSTARSGGAGGT